MKNTSIIFIQYSYNLLGIQPTSSLETIVFQQQNRLPDSFLSEDL